QVGLPSLQHGQLALIVTPSLAVQVSRTKLSYPTQDGVLQQVRVHHAEGTGPLTTESATGDVSTPELTLAVSVRVEMHTEPIVCIVEDTCQQVADFLALPSHSLFADGAGRQRGAGSVPLFISDSSRVEALENLSTLHLQVSQHGTVDEQTG